MSIAAGLINKSLEQLRAVLCDPEGQGSVCGSKADNGIIEEAIERLESVVKSDLLDPPNWNDMPAKSRKTDIEILRRLPEGAMIVARLRCRDHLLYKAVYIPSDPDPPFKRPHDNRTFLARDIREFVVLGDYQLDWHPDIDAGEGPYAERNDT